MVNNKSKMDLFVIIKTLTAMKEQTPLFAFKKGIQQQPAFSRKGRCLSILLGLGMLTGSAITAQTFTPIPVTGWAQDVIAESGTSSLAVTSTVIDGSNYILYSKTFATTNSTSYGLPDNGTIVSGTRTYQMQPFTANNSLYLTNVTTTANSAVTGTLTFATPGIYSKLSVLLTSTEGTTGLTATMSFTDGTLAT